MATAKPPMGRHSQRKGYPPFVGMAILFAVCLTLVSTLHVAQEYFASTISVTVYGTEPTVLNVSATNPDGFYISGDIIFVTVTFDTSVTVDTSGGVPTISLDTGGTAFYEGGSGSPTLTFRYVVAPGHFTSDLAYTSVAALALNGGTIKNSGDDVITTFPAVGAINSLSYNKNIVIGGKGSARRQDQLRDSRRSSGGGDIEEEETADVMDDVVIAQTPPPQCDIDSLPPLPDVSEGDWYYHQVQELRCAGYLESEEEYFRPSGSATRGEIASVLVKGTVRPLPELTRSAFRDVPLDHPFAYEIHAAAEAGWTMGDDNCFGDLGCTYRPDETITRAELAAILLRFSQMALLDDAPSFEDIEEYAWYKGTVYTVTHYCLLLGDDGRNTYRPADPVNRAEMAVALHRALLLWSGVDLCEVIESEYSLDLEAAASILNTMMENEAHASAEEDDVNDDDAAARALVEESERRAACSVCSACGEGLFNFCDVGECSYLGACVPQQRGFLVECIPDPFQC